ncbi:MAG: DUF4062 domain-containing protein [Planctomycetaceae bacterium]|nr:DUF4062 domain-containing protein [Planctomycetaceae bacterium]
MIDPHEPRPPQTVAVWKARPVFVSSTFKDMQAERDHLRQHVFPRLEEQLRQRRVHLEPIDLRQGVETADESSEAARELLVLKVCLDEIKRSRPFLIVLLGDRYGWIPPEERMRAAAEEAGFRTNLTGKSVTALEIEFGLFKENNEQRERTLIFVREPLPYHTMPREVAARYSDEYADDPATRAGYDQLTVLKQAFTADPQLAARVHSYRAPWDAERQTVGDLAAWGEEVYQLLWAELDHETCEFSAQPEPTWEDLERTAFAEFVEHRTRIFHGRGETLAQLTEIATSSANTPWGACVVGDAGSGKSALIARLYQQLVARPDLLVLANAAGISQRSSSIDAMLRRWCGELAAQLQIANPLTERTVYDEVENTFYSLLHRVSQSRRVVLLLDALNQFEQSTLGRHLTWLRARTWPANARIIGTSLPGEQAEALGQWVGIEELELPPLDRADAEQTARGIWARYHRQFNAAVFQVLTEKSVGGVLACGNPLWLTLALEQINLLDADDFARTENEFIGSAAERMRALLLDVARAFPADVEGMFAWLLDRTEKVHGIGPTAAFATAIALSRSGWRESDLLTLVPRLAPLVAPGANAEELAPLRLAALRRAFRGQVLKRAALEQLDFFHVQMRTAALRRYVTPAEHGRQLHSALADHLLALPETDPVRFGESMHHLLEADDRPRAAMFYATLTAPLGVPSPATQTMVDRVLASQDEDGGAVVEQIAALLSQPGLIMYHISILAKRFQFDLEEGLRSRGRLAPRLRLLDATRSASDNLAAVYPEHTGWQLDVSDGHKRVGDVLMEQGNLPAALDAYQASLAINKRVAAADPGGNVYYERQLAVAYSKVGSALMALGNLNTALDAFFASHTIFLRSAARFPRDADPQHDLSVSHCEVGSALMALGNLTAALDAYQASLAINTHLAAADPGNAGWQRDLSGSFARVGDVLKTQGNLPAAADAYQASLAIITRLAAADPGNASWQQDLSMSQSRAGDVLEALGNLPAALDAYQASHAINTRLAAADPENAYRQRDLAESHIKIGEVLMEQGNFPAALDACQASLAISTRLAAAHPGISFWQPTLAIGHSKVGDVLVEQGNHPAALDAYQASLAINKRLAAADPQNAGWQHDLASSHIKVGIALAMQDNLAEASAAYQTGLAICARQAEADPGNAVWQRDMVTAFIHLASLYLKTGNQRNWQECCQKCREVLQRMQHNSMHLDPTSVQFLECLLSSGY